MPMPAFATEAEIPDVFRPEYLQSADGQWRAKLEADVDVERAKRQTLLDEKKDEERKRRDAETKLADLQRTADARAKGISEDELQRIRDAEAVTRKPIEDERNTLRAENRKLKLTDKLQALALKAGVMADRINDGMLLLDARAELGDADGLVFKDATGAVTAQNADQFFAALKTEKPWLFAFEGGGGSGSTGSDRRTTTSTTSLTAAPSRATRSTVLGAF